MCGKTRLMEGQKEQTLSRRRTVRRLIKSWIISSHMSIYRKHVFSHQHTLETFYEYKHMKKADLEQAFLLFHETFFPQRRLNYTCKILLLCCKDNFALVYVISLALQMHLTITRTTLTTRIGMSFGYEKKINLNLTSSYTKLTLSPPQSH